MKIVKKFPKLLGSSVDEEKLSLTVKGLIPLIISVAMLFNIKLDQNELLLYSTALVSAVSAGATLYGGLRKVYIYLKSK